MSTHARFAALRDRLERLLADYRAEVEHFAEDEVYSAGKMRGLGTRIRPLASDAPPIWLWLDAFDDDLVLRIGDFGWFEWRELSDPAWEDDIVSIASAVLEGRVTRRSRLWRTSCAVVMENGTVRRASSGRPIHFSRPGMKRFSAYPSLR